MASSLAKPVLGRRLSELLQEKQEPFLLDVYLLEKGYPKKSSNNYEVRTGCCPGNSSKNSTSLASYVLKTKKKGITHCPRVLRSLLHKLVSVNDNQKTFCDNRAYDGKRVTVSEGERRTHQDAELDRFSSASSMTIFYSCSENDIEESPSSGPNHISASSANNFQGLKLCNPKEEKIATGRELQSRSIVDSKQLSPVSVLEELAFDEVRFCARTTSRKEIPSTPSFNPPNRVTEDSILPASLLKLLVQSLIEKRGFVGVEALQELLGSGSSSQYSKSKRVLQQTKQLLFDCVREVIETHGRKGKRQQDHEFLGAEELRKFICEKIYSWGKQCGDVTNIIQLIDADITDSTEEWCGLQPRIRYQIGMEIADVIMEEMRIEIITDIIDSFALNRC